jgi:hypothetical protein
MQGALQCLAADMLAGKMKPAEAILEQVMDAIEQSKRFMMKGKHHLINKLDK